MKTSHLIIVNWPLFSGTVGGRDSRCALTGGAGFVLVPGSLFLSFFVSYLP